MTDEELAAVLRWRGSALQEGAFPAAADRIEQLTAERDGLLRCVTDNHVALCRAESAEAERDRLKRALEDIIADCEADYPPSHGAIKYAAKLALKGESHDQCA